MNFTSGFYRIPQKRPPQGLNAPGTAQKVPSVELAPVSALPFLGLETFGNVYLHRVASLHHHEKPGFVGRLFLGAAKDGPGSHWYIRACSHDENLTKAAILEAWK